MVKWIIVLLASAALVWRLTKPGGKEPNPQLVRCDKCGVHHARGEPCDCG